MTNLRQIAVTLRPVRLAFAAAAVAWLQWAPATAGEAGSWPAAAAEAGAALADCAATRLRPADINDDETANAACALVGTRRCSDAVFDGRTGRIDPGCALAEYMWWQARMASTLVGISERLANGHDAGPQIALTRDAQAAWQAHAEAHCAYEAAVRGAMREACLAHAAALRASYVLVWMGEF